MSSFRDDEATVLVLHGFDWQDVDIPLQTMDLNDNSSVDAFSQPVSPSEATLDGTQVQDAAVNHGAHEPKIGVPQADNQANGTQATNQTNGVPKKLHKPNRYIPWPVPHIIVDYNGRKYAWGRAALQQTGYNKTCELFATEYCSDLRKRYMFGVNMKLLASLYHTHNCGDEGFVTLQRTGWDAILENVMEIIIVSPPNT